MKKYNFFQMLYLSFFSRAAYQDAAHNWRGTGFAYLFMLVAIFWVPFSLLAGAGLAVLIKEDAPAFIKQLPTIHINKGVVSIDKPVPYFIKNPKTGNVLAIIDTSGKYTSLENTKATVLITKKQGFFKKSADETRVYDFAGVKDFTLTQDKASSIVTTIKNWVVVLMLPVLLGFAFVYRIIVALILAFIGNYIINPMAKTKLQFEQILRLSVIAMTPAYLVGVFFEVSTLKLPFSWFLFGVLTLAYLAFGISANRDQGQANKTQ